MKLAEGVTSKLWLWGKYLLEKWINTFVQKIYEKGATPLVGSATETACHFLKIAGGSGPQVYSAHIDGFIPDSRNRVGGGRHEVGGGRHIKTLALGKIFVGKIGKHIRAEDLRKRRNTIGGAGH